MPEFYEQQHTICRWDNVVLIKELFCNFRFREQGGFVIAKKLKSLQEV